MSSVTYMRRLCMCDNVRTYDDLPGAIYSPTLQVPTLGNNVSLKNDLKLSCPFLKCYFHSVVWLLSTCVWPVAVGVSCESGVEWIVVVCKCMLILTPDVWRK